MQHSLQVNNSYWNIIRLALPISVSILIPQINMLTNTLFVSNYAAADVGLSQQDMLSASGIAGIFYLTFVMIGYGMVSGLLMLMSRRAGENNALAVGEIFSNGIWMVGILSAILMILSACIAPWLFSVAVHDGQVQQACIQYMQIRLWGIPFVMASQLCNALFLATSHANRIVVGSITQTVVNIVFDYVLIFGIGPFPEWGFIGTAFASLFADIAYAATNILQIKFQSAFKQFSIRPFKHFSVHIIRSNFILSAPLMMQYLLSIGAWEVFFIFVEHLGKTESAVSQILRSVFGVVGVATWALASTCNSMVSNMMGQQQFAHIIPLIHKVVRISVGFAAAIGVWIFIFPATFLRLLTADEVLVTHGISALRVVVMATWMLAVATIYFNGVVGLGKTKLNMLFELAAISLYLVYCFIIIEYFRLPLAFAWGSEFVYWLTLFLLSAGYLYKRSWQKIHQL